ncbi:MAG: hypothetical protein ABR589_08700 [Chthoniobacterales bacterium]
MAQGEAPLQADVRARLKNHSLSENVAFHARLEPGVAKVRGRVYNLPGGETALVLLEFNYRTKADIALDEIISKIVISTHDFAGNEFSTATIDPNTIPLNPNRVPLYYSATLYTPPRTAGRTGYITRVQVFGNYE